MASNRATCPPPTPKTCERKLASHQNHVKERKASWSTTLDSAPLQKCPPLAMRSASHGHVAWNGVSCEKTHSTETTWTSMCACSVCLPCCSCQSKDQIVDLHLHRETLPRLPVQPSGSERRPADRGDAPALPLIRHPTSQIQCIVALRPPQ